MLLLDSVISWRRLIVPALGIFSYQAVCAQAEYSNRLSEWKTLFPKEQVVAGKYRETVEFSLNSQPKDGEGPVKATVLTEVELVPLKDFTRYEDGLFYNDETTITDIKVLNADGREVPFDKSCGSYSSEGIFHSDARLCVVRFPLGEKGRAFRYSYKKVYRDIKYLTSLYFADAVPVAERLVRFNVPSWLDADIREFNFAGYSIEKSNTREADISHLDFRAVNLQAYSNEPHTPNHAITYPHVVFVAKGITENGTRRNLFESVKDLYAWYHLVCAAIGNKPEELSALVTQLTAGKKTALEKTESIFYWVQDNIRYIAFENGIMGFRPDAAQNVLKNKYGDCKGKANLLKTMLVLAGLDARLTWIGTSDLPYDYSLPSLAVDNHMICTVIIDGKKYFLDGTESHIALNDYAQRIQGKQVLIENGDSYILDRVPEFPAERNKVMQHLNMSITDNQLTGNATAEYNGESKISVQGAFSAIRSDKKSEALESFLRSGDENIVVSRVEHSDISDRQKPLSIKYEFKANNQVTRSGNEIYVVMDWEKDFSSLSMPRDRKNDYEFNQKYHVQYTVDLQVPAGYKADYLPAAFKKSCSIASAEGSYAAKGNIITYTRKISIQKPIIKKADFAEWNAFIADLNKFYSEQIVLAR